MHIRKSFYDEEARMKQKNTIFYNMLSFIFLCIFIFGFTTCKDVRLDIRNFVEKELARDKSENVIFFYDKDGNNIAKTGNDNVVYVPAETLITAKVPVTNDEKQFLFIHTLEVTDTSLGSSTTTFSTPPSQPWVTI